ncbi:hypothetical protein STRIP9103_04027, partial [Streptomyces ipomoeae 91-03]
MILAPAAGLRRFAARLR